MKIIVSLFLAYFLNSSAHAASEIDQNKIRITDSHGKWVFQSPPKRIAVINWTLTEQLLELGVVPVAIADTDGFKKASPQTQFPPKANDIVDLRSRFEPDLTKLKESAPELIIIGYSQRDLMRPLSNIAPVMYFNNFSRRFDNKKKADERFLVLATLFNKTHFAQNKLNERDQKINKIKESIINLFNDKLPAVTIASLTQKNAWVFLENSIPHGVASQLGLRHELSKEPTKFGTHKIKLDTFNSLTGCQILVNIDLNHEIKFKQNSCSITLENINTYGGAMSQLYIAKAIYQGFKEKLN